MVSKKKSSDSGAKKPSAKKKKGSSKKKKNFFVRALLFFLKVWLVLIMLAGLFFMVVYLGFTGPVPSTEQLQLIKNPVASEVLSDDGQVLGRYYIENRSNVTYNEISPYLIHALVATEDARFYEHRGIDEIALLRVLVKSVLMQDASAGGGSTLSQQIAKNLYPRKRFGPFTMPINKLRESIIAYRLERIYSKEDVLTLYLNTVPFAENTFGVEVACERFFSKKPSEVTVPEAACIVGMLKASNSYNPRKNPERALERRNTVISQMVKYNYLSEAEGEAYKKEPLDVNYQLINYTQGPAPYFMDHLRPKLLDWCENHSKADGTPYNLYTDGLKIRTTLNFDLQHFATLAVSEQMNVLQKVFDQHWSTQNPWGNDNSVVDRAIKRSDYYRELKEQGLDDEAIKAALNKVETRSLFTWKGIEQRQMSAVDSVRHFLRLLNTGFMAMDPSNGAVKAYIGGIDFRFFKYDHVQAQRQVGSTFKPLVYLAALESGVSPDTYFPNEKKVYAEYNNWSPENSHDEYGGYYSMEGALEKSINTIAVEALMRAGADKVAELAHNLGINSELPEYPSLALGAASVSLQEMVCAYSALVNGGHKLDPYLLVSIEDNNGNILEQFEDAQSPDTVASTENCRIIVQMLKSVINSGTGARIRTDYGIDSDFAGKTGTTQDQADGWFIGMNPRLVAGAWVGAEDPAIHFRTINFGQGAYMALPIVGRFFNRAYSSPDFSSWKNDYFETPSPETMAMMDIPPYRDVIEVERKHFDIKKIFKKEQEPEQPREMQEKQVQPENKKEKRTWEKIKDIFRKKK